MAQGMEPRVPQVALFNKVFLRNVNILGRAYELGLVAELKVRTGRITDDLDMGLDMLRRGKFALLPKVVTRRKRTPPPIAVERSPDAVGYFPGCSLHAMAKEYDLSARAVLAALGFQPTEPQGWVCCGSTPAHKLDHRLATQLPLESLITLEQSGFEEVALPCAACFNRFRTSAHDLRRDPDLKQDLEAALGYAYQDRVKITSLVDLVEGRLEVVRDETVQSLSGLKVACYYGCLLSRPPEVTGSDDPEYPTSMDRIMKALGAEVVDWDYKVACCGASLSLTNPDIVIAMSSEILQNARARGADLVAVACPLCHANLDGRQKQMKGVDHLPTLYFTQLMAIAFGMPERAALQRNLIDPRPVLVEHGLLST
jgi:heterodisulfide reductase subunit B